MIMKKTSLPSAAQQSLYDLLITALPEDAGAIYDLLTHHTVSAVASANGQYFDVNQKSTGPLKSYFKEFLYDLYTSKQRYQTHLDKRYFGVGKKILHQPVIRDYLCRKIHRIGAKLFPDATPQPRHPSDFRKSPKKQAEIQKLRQTHLENVLKNNVPTAIYGLGPYIKLSSHHR
jgi:hypothetical protein